jgi:hypothetical protein
VEIKIKTMAASASTGNCHPDEGCLVKGESKEV